MCVAALREDSRNLLVGIGEMPDGTDDEILNTLIGQQVAKLPGLPRYMSPTECSTFLVKHIVADARKRVCVVCYSVNRQFKQIYYCNVCNSN